MHIPTNTNVTMFILKSKLRPAEFSRPMPNVSLSGPLCPSLNGVTLYGSAVPTARQPTNTVLIGLTYDHTND